MATSTYTYAPIAARPAARPSRRRHQPESANRRNFSPINPSKRDEVPHLFLSLGAGVTPAQGSVKPTEGFTFNKVIYPSSSYREGAAECWRTGSPDIS